MKILAPFSKQGEVLPLIEAGASELYCGVVESEWEKKYSLVSSINLRHDRAANISSFSELSKSVEQAHSCKAKVFLTLNAHFYSEKQLPAVMQYAEKASKANVDALIVADSSLIPKLVQEHGFAVSLSTGNPVFNSSALDFFKQIGISRIVFPRHVSVQEIGSLAAHAKKLGIETECFALNVLCPYIDGLCTFQHIVDSSISFLPKGMLACRLPFKATAFSSSPEESRRIVESHVNLWGNTLMRDCGLCGIKKFKEFGVDSVKIAGRAHTLEKKLADIKAIKETIAFASKPFDEFREKCRQQYFFLFHNSCDYLHCYYAREGLE